VPPTLTRSDTKQFTGLIITHSTLLGRQFNAWNTVMPGLLNKRDNLGSPCWQNPKGIGGNKFAHWSHSLTFAAIGKRRPKPRQFSL